MFDRTGGLHLEQVHTLLEVVLLPLRQRTVVMDAHPKHLVEFLLCQVELGTAKKKCILHTALLHHSSFFVFSRHHIMASTIHHITEAEFIINTDVLQTHTQWAVCITQIYSTFQYSVEPLIMDIPN